MAKVRHVFVCRECGAAQHRWAGKCPDCGAWDSLEETTVDPALAKDPQKGLVAAWGELTESGEAVATVAPARPIAEIDADATPLTRIASGIGEFDRVLGGSAGAMGLVPGSAVLIGGEPGIGKSTLLLQAAGAWASRGVRVLYVSSEESAQQVAMRAGRLGRKGEVSENRRDEGGPIGLDGSSANPTPALPAAGRGLYLLADTNLARIVEQTRKVTPAVLIIDSIQMIYKADLPAGPGSITQLRRCCSELVYLAKASGIGVVLVGHVTKDGQLAGPRLLEHLVDAVLSFDGDRHHSHRIVRATKNRFGATLELGLFEMTDRGLVEVPEGASLAALANAGQAPRPGTVICPVITGTRCLMVELQALTATGFLGAAKRKSSGVDPNRLAMLIAVLEQHAGLRLADRDVFASSVGGVKVVEPAADLALLLAIAGAHYKRSLGPATCAIGEVGLGGEVRPAAHLDQRLREAARLGFKTVILPKGAKASLAGVELIAVANVDQAIAQLG
jgi:DNA repair protein RadA/Sms